MVLLNCRVCSLVVQQYIIIHSYVCALHRNYIKADVTYPKFAMFDTAENFIGY